jgi:hypothetical protein
MADENPKPVTVHRSNSKMRQSAKKVGIDVPKRKPDLPETEFEATDEY